MAVGAGLRHCWSMPIKAPDDEVLGTLAFYGPRPRHPLPVHLTLMRDGARLAGIAIERHRTMEALIHDARHDGLTGLPNRAAIFAYLDDALASIGPGSKVAVLFVDLDGLKTLNDTLGLDRADEMIRVVGERLSATVRTDELVGRFGGDEFVVIASRVSSDQEAAELSSRLLDAISAPLLGFESAVVTASVGITLVTAATTDAREAIRQADSAMSSWRDQGSRTPFARRSPTPRFPPDKLTLEITETALMQPDAAINRTMRELERLGIRIVLDDFGTGYSSLSWLKNHPFDGIKIDRSFVKGLPGDVADRAVVAAVVGIAGALGCPVTAEGIETQAHLDAVRSFDCDRGQGFLLARPVTAGDLVVLLSAP